MRGSANARKKRGAEMLPLKIHSAIIELPLHKHGNHCPIVCVTALLMNHLLRRWYLYKVKSQGLYYRGSEVI